MLTVPILLDFDAKRPIGSAVIDETQLPANWLQCHLALGFQATHTDNGQYKGGQLVCLGWIDDAHGAWKKEWTGSELGKAGT